MTNRRTDLAGAIERLTRGELVAIPTETVYGLAARADDARAVAAIFEAKGRPKGHPLIVHLPAASALDAWASEVPPSARRLADVLWPGPLTLVVRRAAHVRDEVTGGLPTVALRVPRHPIALAVIRGVGVPLAAPSANVFGHVSPTTAAHVLGEPFARDVAVLDGGASDVGLESTIVDVTEPVPVLLRPGGTARETIEEILGAPLVDGREGPARAPGMLEAHYAPRARVVAARERAEAEAVVAAASGIAAYVGSAPIEGALFVPAPEDPAARARELYATLRTLDARGVSTIVIELPAEEGLGLAIADRVRRASRGR